MKNSAIVGLLLFSFFLGCKCKKDKDNTAPFVTFITPAENQNFTVGETIAVKFEIKDDTKIEFAQITVTDENQVPVLSSISLSNLQNNQTVEQDLFIDNTYIITGAYYVSVRTGDGSNEQNYFQKIYIQELSIKRKAIYFVGNNAGQHIVYKIDSAFSKSIAYSLNGDFIGSKVDSKHRQLITSGGFTGKLLTTKLSDYSEVWSENPVGSTYPAFRNIAYGNGLNFVSYNSGFIKGYDYLGAVQFNAVCDQNVYYPLKVGISNKYILNEQAAFVGNTKKLVLYNYPSGSAKQQINFTGDVVEIFPKNDYDFFIFYNGLANPEISLYNSYLNTFTFNFVSTIFGDFLSAAPVSSGSYLIGTSNGIYKYTYNPQNIIQFKTGIKASGIYFDLTTNEVIASEGKSIYFYDYTSGILKNTITSGDSIVDFQLLYNR